MGKFVDLLVKLKVLRYDPFAKLAAERISKNSEEAAIKSAKNPASSYKLNPERLKKSEKHFLTTFRSVTEIDWFSKGTDWGAIYKRSLRADPEFVFSAFLENELVKSATPEELIDADYRVSDLKNELRNRGLKVSGKKADLIHRFLSAEPDFQSFLKTPKPRCVLTDRGRAITEEYFLQEEKKKKQALAKFRKEFYCGNLLAAEEAAVAYRNRHPLGAGLSEGKFILKIGLKNYLAAFHL